MEYTFYIAVNKSLTRLYGDKGTPVKVGYSDYWPKRVRALNGREYEGEEKYGAIKSGCHVLEDNWWIPEGCFLTHKTKSPISVEDRIKNEILSRGGEKIEGHATKRHGEEKRAEELFLIKKETKLIRLRKGKVSWQPDVHLFGGRVPGTNHAFETVETIVPVESILQGIMNSVSEGLADSESDEKDLD